jgi:hypothetical protein
MESCNDMTYHDIAYILFIAFSFWIHSAACICICVCNMSTA